MSCPREQGNRSPGCGVGDGRGRRRKQQSPSCLRLRKNLAPAIFRWRFGAPSVAPSRRGRVVCALVISAWRWGTPRVPAPRAAHWSGSKPEEQGNHTRREAHAEEAWARKELHAAEVETCGRGASTGNDPKGARPSPVVGVPACYAVHFLSKTVNTYLREFCLFLLITI